MNVISNYAKESITNLVIFRFSRVVQCIVQLFKGTIKTL